MNTKDHEAIAHILYMHSSAYKVEGSIRDQTVSGIAKDLADYFEKEDKRSTFRKKIPRIFKRKKFLKAIGVK